MPSSNYKVKYFKGTVFAIIYGMVGVGAYCLISLIGIVASLTTALTVSMVIKGWMKGATVIDRKSFKFIKVIVILLIIFSFFTGIYTEIVKEVIIGINNGSIPNTFITWIISPVMLVFYVFSGDFFPDQWINIGLTVVFAFLGSYSTLKKLGERVDLLESFSKPKTGESDEKVEPINGAFSIEDGSKNKNNSTRGILSFVIIIMIVFIPMFLRASTSSNQNTSNFQSSNSSAVNEFAEFARSASSSKASQELNVDTFMKSNELSLIESGLSEKFQIYFNINKVVATKYMFGVVDDENNAEFTLCNPDTIKTNEDKTQSCMVMQDMKPKYSLGATPKLYYLFHFVDVTSLDLSECHQTEPFIFRFGVLNQDGKITVKHCDK